MLLHRPEANKDASPNESANHLLYLMHEIYVREAIERGLADSKESRTVDVSDIRAEYGLPE
jgi:hypothetical protein